MSMIFTFNVYAIISWYHYYIWYIFTDWIVRLQKLSSKSVKSASLSLQCIDDIHCCNCLPLGMFGVGNCITDYIFQEDFQNSSGFFVNKSRDSLHSSSACQSTDSWFGDTLDVISQHLAMTFCSSFSQSLSSFASSRHFV